MQPHKRRSLPDGLEIRYARAWCARRTVKFWIPEIAYSTACCWIYLFLCCPIILCIVPVLLAMLTDDPAGEPLELHPKLHFSKLRVFVNLLTRPECFD